MTYTSQQEKRIKDARLLVRPVIFSEAILKSKTTSVYNGDIDGMHIDYTRNMAFILDLKYQLNYRGLVDYTRKMYEHLAKTMTAGGLLTCVLICGHQVDYKTNEVNPDPTVPLESCSVLEMYKDGEWSKYNYGELDATDTILSLKDAKFKADDPEAYYQSLMPKLSLH